jgi:hypothetical protein
MAFSRLAKLVCRAKIFLQGRDALATVVRLVRDAKQPEMVAAA